jgi:homoserine O-acetyltransferase
LEHLRHGTLTPIPSIWGHRAGNPLGNAVDTAFVKTHVRAFLEG